MRLKKTMACITLAAAMMMPIKQASAIVWMAPVLWLFGNSAGAITLGSALEGSAVTIGAAIALIKFNHKDQATTSTTDTPITINLDPNTPLTTPAGWTPPVAPSTKPTPPATASKGDFYSNGDGKYYVSAEEACNAKVSATESPTSYAGDIAFTETTCSWKLYTRTSGTLNGTYTNLAIVKNSSVCPSGYTASGTTCTLSTPTAVFKPSDDRCTVIRTGNTFSGDPNDTDCLTSNLRSKLNTDLSNNCITTKNAQGTVTASACMDSSTGRMTLKQSDPNTSGGTDTITATLDKDGKVDGIKKETFNGQGSQTSTTANTTVNNTGSGSNVDVSSLNKEATQQSIDSKLGQIRDKMNTEGADVEVKGLPDQPTDGYYKTDYPDGIQGVWNNFKAQADQTAFVSLAHSMAPNWEGGTCPTWTMDFSALGFGSMSFNSICWIFAIIRAIFIVTALFTARALIFGG